MINILATQTSSDLVIYNPPAENVLSDSIEVGGNVESALNIKFQFSVLFHAAS